MAFELIQTDETATTIDQLKQRDVRKYRKVAKALVMLATDPSYPGLVSHRFEHVAGPAGEPIWESCLENKTPSAWRIWWFYGPATGQITVVAIGPHS